MGNGSEVYLLLHLMRVFLFGEGLLIERDGRSAGELQFVQFRSCLTTAGSRTTSSLP